MRKPLIGVTTRGSFSERYQIPVIASPRPYCDALVRAGSIPVLIPLNLPQDSANELLSQLDGVVFTGGGDIETVRFGGEDHAQIYDVDAERDEMELQLVRMAADSEKPFLGICRGLQILNVAYGGSLYTHIPDQMKDAMQHSFFLVQPWDYLAHPVQVLEGTLLSEIAGEPILQVNSLHHQGVKDLAAGLKAVAHAPDGLVEGLELTGHPFALAVQWHPECLPNDPTMRGIFEALVTASREKIAA
ncbi:MAG: gamma-glutamyl-gamma-aminobutyrate hydrolase family protein [Anaerolineae bacterium]|nr:MAG: gamma-glutamyl-gamma-aminobutyrate hydrolase family protein [Anaerolineae bacterium]